MNFVKRGEVSLRRRFGKTAVLLGLVFILGNIMAGAVSVRQAVSRTEENLRNSLPAVAAIELDQQACGEAQGTPGSCVVEARMHPNNFREVGALPYVHAFEFAASHRLYSRQLVRHFEPNPELPIDAQQDANSMAAQLFNTTDLEWFFLRGGHNAEPLEMQEGVIELVSGRHFTEDEMENLSFVAMVSEPFAQINNLTVGSIIDLEDLVITSNPANWADFYEDDNIDGSEVHELEVVGIFSIPEAPDNNHPMIIEWNPLTDLANLIYVPNLFIERTIAFRSEVFEQLWDIEPVEIQSLMFFDYNIYVLNDPRDLDAFAAAANEILPGFYRVFDLSNTYAHVAASMENLDWIANLILWVAAGATLVILNLLILLFLRDRKHEIGIYLALGEKKIKVVFQILLEILTISFVAISFSIFTGNLFADNLSRNMLEIELQNQVTTDPFATSTFGNSLTWFSPGIMTTDEMQANFDTSLDATTIFLFYGVGIVVALLSTALPILYITHLNPKRILL